MGVDPNDVEILSEIEGIVRTKDVVGEIDVSQLDCHPGLGNMVLVIVIVFTFVVDLNPEPESSTL